MERNRYQEISIVEKNGLIISRDILVQSNIGIAIITVGNSEFLNELIKHRQREGLPPPNEYEVFLINHLDSFEEVCTYLQTIPPDELEPYLAIQNTASEK